MDKASGAILAYGENSELSRRWRILQSLSLEGDGQLEAAVDVLRQQSEIDERTSGLDDAAKESLLSILERMHDQMGFTETESP